MKVNETTLRYLRKVDSEIQVTSSSVSEKVFRTHWNDSMSWQESFYALFLDRRGKVIAISEISKGGLTGTVVDAKIIFSQALLHLASGIILAHNHPSGDTSPSKADIEITKKLVKGGKLLDITVLDHLIITKNSYLSFADEEYI